MKCKWTCMVKFLLHIWFFLKEKYILDNMETFADLLELLGFQCCQIIINLSPSKVRHFNKYFDWLKVRYNQGGSK